MPKKSLKLFVILFLFASCNQPAPGADIEPCSLDITKSMQMGYYVEAINTEAEPDQPPKDCVVPEREEEANLNFQVQLTNFDVEEESKMRDALRRARIVLNSKAFKQKMLEHLYNGERTFVDNNGQTNEEIYNTIMSGAETLLPEVDQEMDLDITLYYRPNSTVGYTYPDTTRIWVNNKFFKRYTLGQVANNAVHEWTHKLGYGHSYYNNAERPFSVPYAVGEIVEELVDGM